MADADKLLTTTEAAELLHVPVSTLAYWRANGDGPRYAKLGGGRRVFYRRSDVEGWLNAQFVDVR